MSCRSCLVPAILVVSSAKCRLFVVDLLNSIHSLTYPKGFAMMTFMKMLNGRGASIHPWKVLNQSVSSSWTWTALSVHEYQPLRSHTNLSGLGPSTCLPTRYCQKLSWSQCSTCTDRCWIWSTSQNVLNENAFIEATRALPSGVDLYNAHFINHSGLAVISRPGAIVAKVESKLKSKSLEHLCCPVGSGCASLIITAIYRPGLQGVRDLFFTELSVLFKMLSTLNCGILVTGDFNIHLERPSNMDS